MTDDTVRQRRDPRVKVIVALLLIVGIVATPDRAFPAYPLLWALLASMAAGARIGVWQLASRSSIALPFVLAASTLIFTTSGTPLFTVLGITATDAGLIRFLAIALKSWLAVQVSLLLSITTPFSEIIWALQSLRLPAVLVLIICLMYRYLFTLKDEAERLLRARASRTAAISQPVSYGSSYLTRLRWRAQVAGGMVGSLFLRSYERSERVYAAMLSRGYHYQDQGHLPSQHPPLTGGNLVLGAVPIAVLLLIQIAARLWWNR